MHRFCFPLAAATLVLALPVSTILAATYFVRTTGSDGNSGLSAATALRNVDTAVDLAGPGDIVYVGAGTYSEQVTPANGGAAGAPIRILADTTGVQTGDAGQVVISGGNIPAVAVDGADYIEINGFRLHGIQGIVTWKNSLGGVVERCELTGTASSAGGGGGDGDEDHADQGGDTQGDSDDEAAGSGIFVSNASLVIRRCDIHDAKEGLYAENASFIVINSVIHDNKDGGVVTKNSSASSAIWNSVIDDNGEDGVEHKGGTLAIYNCIISNNDGNGLKRKAGSMSHSHNLFFNNEDGDYSGTSAGVGESSADPLFVSMADYHLWNLSPAIDTGKDAVGTVDVDRDGNARPLNGTWDIGAYEYGSAVPAPPRIITWTEVDPQG